MITLDAVVAHIPKFWMGHFSQFQMLSAATVMKLNTTTEILQATINNVDFCYEWNH